MIIKWIINLLLIFFGLILFVLEFAATIIVAIGEFLDTQCSILENELEARKKKRT